VHTVSNSAKLDSDDDEEGSTTTGEHRLAAAGSALSSTRSDSCASHRKTPTNTTVKPMDLSVVGASTPLQAVV
jgi:hypothetical protein